MDLFDGSENVEIVTPLGDCGTPCQIYGDYAGNFRANHTSPPCPGY